MSDEQKPVSDSEEQPEQPNFARQLLPEFQRWRESHSSPASRETLVERIAELRSMVEKYESQAKSEGKEAEFRQGMAMIARLEWMLTPEGIASQLVTKMVQDTPNAQPHAGATAELRAILEALPEAEQRQALYLQKLVLTDDAFGIILRGHVLIENTLQACIYAYVPEPVDLYGKLELFARQKIDLAYMLGIVSKDERALLGSFNALRNKLAHFDKGTKYQSPDFQFTAKDEEKLWKEFVTNPAAAGEWPPYDAAKFPRHLRYIVSHLYLMLSERWARVEAKRLTPVHETVVLSETERSFRNLYAIMFVKLMGAVGGVADDDSASGNPVTEPSA